MTEQDSPPSTDTPADLLPARMLNEYAYCPRLFYLEYVQGEFEHSADTVDGRFKHRRVETDKGAMPAAGEGGDDEKIHARSIMLGGEKCGFIAKMDLIEGEGDVVTPIDYKRGKKPDTPGMAWLADRVQVCAQGLILRENGYHCDAGVIYYIKSKERVPVVFEEKLVAETLRLADEARRTAESGEIPPPLRDSPKCPRCSLVGICLPDELNAVNEVVPVDEIRRLVPLRDDDQPLYVQEQGAMIAKKGEQIEVRLGGQTLGKVRLLDTSQISLFGNIMVTPALLHNLCERGVPVCYFSHGGWFYGITHGMTHKNVELRIRQYVMAMDRSKSLPVARRIVEGKIRNCRTLLRRNHPAPPEAALEELSAMAQAATEARSHEELLGIEGTAARVYFMHFGAMLKGEGGLAFNFQHRNRRPPRDPVNALLSYLYAVMAKDLTVTLLAVGFDPYLGVYHTPRYGRPSLALDLMEEFRPLIADSVVITLINNAEVKQDDFIIRAGAATMTPEARKKLLAGYERRLDATVTHPLFGYSISYRRILEVQVRLLGRYLAGEIPEYPPFCTR
jgi:CRISPR-associated protein Cas1